MEDLYGSKDDDVDEDTKYIAQSLIASPLAEFYGLDVPTVSLIFHYHLVIFMLTTFDRREVTTMIIQMTTTMKMAQKATRNTMTTKRKRKTTREKKRKTKATKQWWVLTTRTSWTRSARCPATTPR